MEGFLLQFLEKTLNFLKSDPNELKLIDMIYFLFLLKCNDSLF